MADRLPGGPRPLGSCRDMILKFCETHGVWLAGVVVERCLTWPLTHAEEMQEVVMPRGESLGRVAQLIPETPTGGDGQGSPAVPKSERALK